MHTTKRKASMSEVAVHRDIHLGDHGDDVKAAQAAANHRLTHYKLEFMRVEKDGEYFNESMHGCAHAAFAMGLSGSTVEAITKGDHRRLSKRVQKLLRNPQRRGPIARARQLARRPILRKWRRQYHEAHPDVPPVIQAMVSEINRLIAKSMPYLWGGGHGTPANSGPGDCSWFASRLVQMLAPGMATGTTFTLASDSHLTDGKGSFLTLHIKNVPAGDAHVICELFDGHTTRWCETGGRDNTEHGGPCWFTPTSSRINEFPIKRHVKGF
jgi:hypothetical protein